MLTNLCCYRYYINQNNVPKVLQWIQHISLIKYAFEALCINEFKGLTFVPEGPASITTGEQVLQRL
jgi:hypothetical protein